MITKKFNKTYDDALTQAYLFHSEFVKEKANFSAFSPVFADPFADDFYDLITDADDFPTNEEDLNNQVILSTKVEETMEKARAQYQKMLFYVGIAWPDSESMMLAFGSNLYEKARKLPHKMMNLLQSAYRNANSVEYKADLIAAGFTQVEIDLLHTLDTELTTRYNDQQDYIQHSYKRTEQRTIAFNNVWDEMVKISNASKIIFKDSPAMIEFFLLYPDTGTVGKLTAPQNFMFDPVNYDFSWSAVENATSYILQESTDGTNWTEYWAGHETTCAYEESPTTMMYFRVLAHNASGNGPASSVIQYDFAPTLVAPGSFHYNPETYYFTWTAVPNAEYYEFQYRVQTNPTWNSLNAGDATSFLHADPVGNYLARVRAVSGSTMGPWSIELEYTVGPIQPD